MKKAAFFLSLLLMFQFAMAETLPADLPGEESKANQAEVQAPFVVKVTKTWTANEARKEAFANALMLIDTSRFSAIDPNFIENKQAIANHTTVVQHRAITVFDGGYGVAELCSLSTAYYFFNGKLGALDLDSTPGYADKTCPNSLPAKSYKYSYPDGALGAVAIRISANELYSFKPNTELFAHWIGPKCYLSNGLSCGIRKAFKY